MSAAVYDEEALARLPLLDESFQGFRISDVARRSRHFVHDSISSVGIGDMVEEVKIFQIEILAKKLLMRGLHLGQREIPPAKALRLDRHDLGHPFGKVRLRIMATPGIYQDRKVIVIDLLFRELLLKSGSYYAA